MSARLYSCQRNPSSISSYLPRCKMLMIDSTGVDQATTSVPSEVLAETAPCLDGLPEVEMDDFWHARHMLCCDSGQLGQIIDG